MGRISGTKELNIWMNGVLLGCWKLLKNGQYQFNYYDSWLESPACRPLSLSLPLQPANLAYKGAVVESYFDNLLPDSDIIRKRLQSRFGTPSIQAFHLLEEIGRDCIGAIQLLPADVQQKNIEEITGESIDEKDIERILASIPSQSRFSTLNKDDFRISIAGAQEKTALLYHHGAWQIPHGTTPSTHIFKLPIGQLPSIDLSTSLENEWLCSKIVEAYGIEVAQTQLAHFGNQKALIVKRFDRKPSADSSWIMRIPQEDMCQATGTSSGFKYEADGGPGTIEIMRLLLGSKKMTDDRYKFMKTVLLFWLLAAPDGHAKNFSIFLERKGEYFLTPMYDILSIYPVMGQGKNKIPWQKLKMAMGVWGKNKHYDWNNIFPHHWLETAKKAGMNSKIMIQILDEIITSTPEVILKVQNLIPKKYPLELADSILLGVQKAVKIIKERMG